MESTSRYITVSLRERVAPGVTEAGVAKLKAFVGTAITCALAGTSRVCWDMVRQHAPTPEALEAKVASLRQGPTISADGAGGIHPGPT